MARYRGDLEEDRDFYARNERFGRERPWNYNDPRERDYSLAEERRERFGRGRFGERAEHEYDEPRYGGYGYDRNFDYGRSAYERDYRSRKPEFERGRSRLRVRDIMTRDLAVATRDTTVRELAIMMKDEDTGVIPVVEFELNNGDDRKQERRYHSGTGNHGKLIGLVTDRDIVLRAVAEDKDCRTRRAEEIMSTNTHTVKPNDRVIDLIHKMGEKQVRRIPVVGENGQLRGMVSLGDVALETEADEELADALEDISKESSFWSQILGS
jgi:CBS domain-containing protein